MRIPANCFDADDKELCGLHSRCIDLDIDSRHFMEALDAWCATRPGPTVRAFEVGVHMPADLPLPPSYDEDLEEWFKSLKPAGDPALIGFDLAKTGADAWHSEPPPGPGVYIASSILDCTIRRHWDGKAWSLCGDAYDDIGPATYRARVDGVMWLRLVSPDPAPTTSTATDWRLGSDIPKAERVGLWYVREIGESRRETARRTAHKASFYRFQSNLEYRSAAPGVQEGDPYDESRYAAQATPEQAAAGE